jgi:two-component system sensor histidine kinase GlrK
MLGEQLEWLRNRLIKLEEEKNLFLRRMSHELKTPLASLREGSELLLDGTAGGLSETQMEIADILRSNSMELQFLIENLLDYEEWRERSGELRVSRFAFRPLVEATLQRHRLTIGTKQLHVEQHFGDFDLQADRDRIRIAFDNLISNAVKFTPAGGTIYVRAAGAMNANGAVIEVADTGPGIQPADRDRIFEPFYQGETAPDGHLRGTGVGLSVVRDCVNAHGGTIEVVEGEYPGAHFRIRLQTPPAAV